MDDARAELLAESNGALVEELRAELAASGRMTFARFMELALYHPTHGYYATDAVRAGFEGDFLTGPETDPIFGQALARQVAECWDVLGHPAPFTVREVGAGRGSLAAQIVDGLRATRPDLLGQLRYELADINPARLDEAVRRISEVVPDLQVGSAGDEPFTGVLLANELLDALPFHRLVVDGELREIWVVWRDGWFADEVGELSSARLAESTRDLPLQDGQRLEVSPAAWDWSATIGRQLARGLAIAIDYGYPAAELYAPARFDGTLKTYSQHLVAEDPYRRVGTQDITAHVDFSAVIAAAEAGGCDLLGLTTQAYFFAGLGIEELLLELQHSDDPYRYVNARQTVMHLLDPRGLGRFRVLLLGKGIDRETPLRGLSFRLA